MILKVNLLIPFAALVLVSLIQSSVADQAKLFVLKSPSYQHYDFSLKTPLKTSDFKNLLLAANRISTPQSLEWSGLKSSVSWKKPKVSIVVLADNKNIKPDDISSQFISLDEDVSINFQFLKNYVSDSQVKAVYGIPDSLDQEKLKTECTSLNSAFYLIQSAETNGQTLKASIQNLIENLPSECNDNFMVYLLATNVAHRVKRQAPSADPNKIDNEAEFYSDQYPAMFNLLFWTSLILGITIFAIVYALMGMDPGLDTVIYRMTSQRIKKDQ